MEMFDISAEKPISLHEAAAWLPKKKNGKPIAIATIMRWIINGHHGIHLEGGRFGDTFCTSVESLRRFAHRSVVQDANAAKERHSSPAEQRREQTRAKKQLDAAGWGSGKGKPKTKTGRAPAGSK